MNEIASEDDDLRDCVTTSSSSLVFIGITFVGKVMVKLLLN